MTKAFHIHYIYGSALIALFCICFLLYKSLPAVGLSSLRVSRDHAVYAQRWSRDSWLIGALVCTR